MNPTFAISSIALIIFVLSGITGGNKPPLAFKSCPKHQRIGECLAEAQGASESYGYCHYIKPIYENHELNYISCQPLKCVEPLRRGKEDPSKPYPLCCAQCV